MSSLCLSHSEGQKGGKICCIGRSNLFLENKKLVFNSKAILLKATFIFALKEPNNSKALKDITELSQTCITPFPSSGSSHRVSTSQVYKIKRSNHSEPNYICCRFNVFILLNYAHFQNKIKIIWNL